MYKLILIAIIHRNNKSEILLTKRNREPEKGKWALPGGRGALDQEKDPNKAIVNEVFSDFGVLFTNPKLLTIQYTETDQPTLRMYYEGNLDAEPKIKSSKTIQELQWFPIREVLYANLAFHATDNEVLRGLV